MLSYVNGDFFTMQLMENELIFFIFFLQNTGNNGVDRWAQEKQFFTHGRKKDRYGECFCYLVAVEHVQSTYGSLLVWLGIVFSQPARSRLTFSASSRLSMEELSFSPLSSLGRRSTTSTCSHMAAVSPAHPPSAHRAREKNRRPLRSKPAAALDLSQIVSCSLRARRSKFLCWMPTWGQQKDSGWVPKSWPSPLHIVH